MLAGLWNGPLWKAWTNLQGGHEAALFCVIVHSYFSPSFCPQMDFIKTSSRWCVKLIWEVRLCPGLGLLANVLSLILKSTCVIQVPVASSWQHDSSALIVHLFAGIVASWVSAWCEMEHCGRRTNVEGEARERVIIMMMTMVMKTIYILWRSVCLSVCTKNHHFFLVVSCNH